jgi:hypothetical protein
VQSGEPFAHRIQFDRQPAKKESKLPTVEAVPCHPAILPAIISTIEIIGHQGES